LLKEKIIAGMKGFSSTQAKVARFILENPREAPFMTASQMAESVDTSESSVIRFASILGYSGYPELKEAMKSLLLDQMTTIERMAVYDDDPRESPCHRIMTLDMLDLGESQTNLNPQGIRSWASEVLEAPAIYMAAQRSSLALAGYLSFYLSWFHPSVHQLNDTLIREQLTTAPKGSMMMGISFPRYSRWTVEAMKLGRSLGLTLTAISDSPHNPMTEAEPEHVLTAPCRHISFIDSLTAPMSLMNCLIMAVADEMGDEAKKRLQELEELWTENPVYTVK